LRSAVELSRARLNPNAKRIRAAPTRAPIRFIRLTVGERDNSSIAWARLTSAALVSELVERRLPQPTCAAAARGGSSSRTNDPTKVVMAASAAPETGFDGAQFTPDRWHEVEDAMVQLYASGITHTHDFVNVIADEAYAAGLAGV
jgi:hypothetical protein